MKLVYINKCIHYKYIYIYIPKTRAFYINRNLNIQYIQTNISLQSQHFQTNK